MSHRTRISLFAAVLLLVFSISVFSDLPTSLLNTEWESAAKTHGLQEAYMIPSGVTPLKVESVKELEQLLAMASRGPSHVVLCNGGPVQSINRSRVGITALSPQSMYETIAIDVREIHDSYVCNVLWRTRFNLWFTVYVASSGSFHWIDDIRSVRVGLTGIHPFIDLEDTWTDVYMYSDLQRAIVSGGGTLEYYLLLDDVLVYYSESVGITYYYHI